MAEQAVEQSLEVENRGAVAWIRLNRPDRMNAVDTALRRQLADALKQVERDASVRCVVLTGAGDRAFCSGADVHEFGERLKTGPDPKIAEDYTAILTRLRGMPKPTIAALNGVAAGIGASFAIACDIRYAVPTASFIEAFVNIGLTVDGGVSWMLPRIIGRGRALEMFYTAKPLTAEEAERLGLVNRVVAAGALETEVQAVADRIAAGPPNAIAAMKRSVSYAEGSSFEEALDFEFALQTVQMAAGDFSEGVTAFLEKRQAKFTGE
jgi:2-(1,2-epoxy-1,2-dihydrophenyl)acetyl-CoA isomerase